MKKIIAVFAFVCVLAAAGCNNGNNTQTTTTDTAETTTAADGTTISTEAYPEMTDENDTTEEALAYLEKVVPIFKKYLDKRRTMPLTFETTITTADGVYKSGLYIKDEDNIAEYSMDPDGNETTVFYTKDTGYQITTADRVIYKYDCGEGPINAFSRSYRMVTLNAEDIEKATYMYGPEEYEGKEYYKVAVSRDDDPSAEPDNIMYFDLETEELVYSISNGSVTKVDKFENTFTKDEIFTLPEGYEVRSYNEYLEELQKEQAEAAEKAKAASEQAESQTSDEAAAE